MGQLAYQPSTQKAIARHKVPLVNGIQTIRKANPLISGWFTFAYGWTERAYVTRISPPVIRNAPSQSIFRLRRFLSVRSCGTERYAVIVVMKASTKAVQKYHLDSTAGRAPPVRNPV